MSNLQQQRSDVTHIDGNLHQNADARIGIVVGRFNGFVVESLVDGAIDALLRHGVLGSNITVVRVPGAYELQNRMEIPYKVVLDEAMKLNNHFGATDAHKLINAVLDKMAGELRALEVQADTNANLRTSQKVPSTQEATPADNAKAASETTDAIDEAPTASSKPRISNQPLV